MSKKLTRKKVLVVMDASPKFLGDECGAAELAKRKEVRANILSAIDIAQRDDFYIVVIEYDGDPTLLEIMTPIASKSERGRQYAGWRKLRMDDGADMILIALNKYKIEPTEIYFCGSIFEWCVKSAIHGLRHWFFSDVPYYPKVPISIIRNATLTQKADEAQVRRWAIETGTGLVESLDKRKDPNRVVPNNKLQVDRPANLEELMLSVF